MPSKARGLHVRDYGGAACARCWRGTHIRAVIARQRLHPHYPVPLCPYVRRLGVHPTCYSRAQCVPQFRERLAHKVRRYPAMARDSKNDPRTRDGVARVPSVPEDVLAEQDSEERRMRAEPTFPDAAAPEDVLSEREREARLGAEEAQRRVREGRPPAEEEPRS